MCIIFACANDVLRTYASPLQATAALLGIRDEMRAAYETADTFSVGSLDFLEFMQVLRLTSNRKAAQGHSNEQLMSRIISLLHITPCACAQLPARGFSADSYYQMACDRGSLLRRSLAHSRFAPSQLHRMPRSTMRKPDVLSKRK